MQSRDDRDRAVERLLRQSAGATTSPRQDHCLDAEIAAAWVDGNLLPHEREAVESHVSECARCQALVATVIRTTPAAPVAAPWWQPSRWGWLVPLAAGAAAVILWVVTPNDVRPPSDALRKVGEQSSTQALRQEPPVLDDRFAPPAPANEERAPAAPTSQVRERTTSETARADEADAAGQRSGDATDQLKPDQPGNAVGQEQSVASAEASARAAAPSGALMARQAITALEIVSPDPTIRWRLVEPGVVQYSTDGGKTWAAQATGATVALTAGASPSPSVCWLVGPAGTILLTTDGRGWQRLAFPDAVDLVAVQAVDARAATVSDRDGRRFRTTDGGTTWNQVPLQEF